MKIAIFTPIPPQKTGIAYYSYDLVLGLSKIKDLHITVCANIDGYINDDIEVVNVTKAHNLNYKDFDVIIYQFGNNIEFHSYMYEILKKYSGIIHLHDIVLHQVLADVLKCKHDKTDYLYTLKKLYGKKISLIVNDLFEIDVDPWTTPLVTKLPCFESFVQYADACIVHSDYARKIVEEKFPNKKCYKINQTYNISPKAVDETDVIRLGVFGGVEANRRVETIIESLAEVISKNQDAKVELIIVGAITQVCQDIFELPKKLGIETTVHFYNHVEDDKFLELLNSVDAVIALRDPTVGETSAVVSKALQLNKPLIVSNVGWYSELPDFVDKLSNENLKEELTTLVHHYVFDKELLYQKKKLIQKYAKEKLDFHTYIEDYYSMIQAQILKKSNTFIISKITSYLKEFHLDKDQNSVKRMAEKLKILF